MAKDSAPKKQPTILVAGQQVVLGDSLYGIRWWAQHYQQKVPAFDPMFYFGSSPDNKLHYFRSKRSNAIIMKTQSGLFSPHFRPFLLNIKQIEAIINL
jgi:hypothetical protein